MKSRAHRPRQPEILPAQSSQRRTPRWQLIGIGAGRRCPPGHPPRASCAPVARLPALHPQASRHQTPRVKPSPPASRHDVCMRSPSLARKRSCLRPVGATTPSASVCVGARPEGGARSGDRGARTGMRGGHLAEELSPHRPRYSAGYRGCGATLAAAASRPAGMRLGGRRGRSNTSLPRQRVGFPFWKSRQASIRCGACGDGVALAGIRGCGRRSGPGSAIACLRGGCFQAAPVTAIDEVAILGPVVFGVAMRTNEVRRIPASTGSHDSYARRSGAGSCATRTIAWWVPSLRT